MSQKKHIMSDVEKQDSGRMAKWSYVSMLISVFAWVTGYVYANENKVSAQETAMLRGWVLVLFSWIFCRYNMQELNIRDWSSFKSLILRNLIFVIHGIFTAGIQFYLPLPMVHTVGQTGPFFLFLMDYLFESTKPTPGQFLGLIFTGVGVLLTANGRMLSEFFDPNYSFDTAFPNYKVQDSLSILIASLVYMVNMMAWAYAVYITKYIRGSGFQINFSFGWILFCVSSLIYSINNTHSQPSTFYWGLLWVGTLLAIAETGFVLAIKWSAKVSQTIIIGSATIPVSYFLSIVLYQETVDIFCLVGTILLIYGIYRILSV